MKKTGLTLILLLLAVGVQAQRLVIGEKAPEIRVAAWYENRASALTGKAVLIDFFHAANAQTAANLSRLDALQQAGGGRLNVILVTREGLDTVEPSVAGKGYTFYIGRDDGGKTFTGYGVRFVPFAALVDARGRLVWTGNVATLNDDTLEKALK